MQAITAAHAAGVCRAGVAVVAVLVASREAKPLAVAGIALAAGQAVVASAIHGQVGEATVSRAPIAAIRSAVVLIRADLGSPGDTMAFSVAAIIKGAGVVVITALALGHRDVDASTAGSFAAVGGAVVSVIARLRRPALAGAPRVADFSLGARIAVFTDRVLGEHGVRAGARRAVAGVVGARFSVTAIPGRPRCTSTLPIAAVPLGAKVAILAGLGLRQGIEGALSSARLAGVLRTIQPIIAYLRGPGSTRAEGVTGVLCGARVAVITRTPLCKRSEGAVPRGVVAAVVGASLSVVADLPCLYDASSVAAYGRLGAGLAGRASGPFVHRQALAETASRYAGGACTVRVGRSIAGDDAVLVDFTALVRRADQLPVAQVSVFTREAVLVHVTDAVRLARGTNAGLAAVPYGTRTSVVTEGTLGRGLEGASARLGVAAVFGAVVAIITGLALSKAYSGVAKFSLGAWIPVVTSRALAGNINGRQTKARGDITAGPETGLAFNFSRAVLVQSAGLGRGLVRPVSGGNIRRRVPGRPAARDKQARRHHPQDHPRPLVRVAVKMPPQPRGVTMSYR